MAKARMSPVATSIPFDNETNGFVSDNVQDAIEEVNNFVSSLSNETFVFFQYNGNANVNRYLELFSGISVDDAPLKSLRDFYITGIVARTTASAATCTISFLDIQPTTPVTLYTITFNNQKDVLIDMAPQIFTLPANGELAIRVTSGSILKPHIYIIGQSA